MELIEFKSLLANRPMRRTAKGARIAIGMASDLPERQTSLLRRFTGATLFEHLIASDEPIEAACRDAHALFQRGLIEPLD